MEVLSGRQVCWRQSMKAIFVNEIKSLLHNGINGVLDRANGIGIVVSIWYLFLLYTINPCDTQLWCKYTVAIYFECALSVRV